MKTYRYEFTIRSPEDVAFKLLVDLEQLEARYRNTYPVAVESASLRAFVIDTLTGFRYKLKNLEPGGRK